MKYSIFHFMENTGAILSAQDANTALKVNAFAV